MLSNVSIPLLSSVDVALMGQLSILHLGAIGLATVIFNFVFWNFGFLRMGTTGLVAQAYGAGDQKQIHQLCSKGIYSALVIAIVILILQQPLGIMANFFLGISLEHSPLVWTYFSIRVWSAPATLMTYSLFGWLFGMQNALAPMGVTIFTNILNILASYYMVSVLGWEISGVAIGTLLAEYAGVAILLVIIFRRYKIRLIHPANLVDWSRFLFINRDLFIRTVALTTAFAFLYRASALSGELILAANVIMLQFLSWMSYGIDGFAFASESLVGRHFGSQNKKMIRKSIVYSFMWAFALAVIISVIFWFFTEDIGLLFSKDKDVVKMLVSYKLWLLSIPLLACASYIWDGIFIGLTKTSMMRDSMLVSLVFYILIFILIRPYYANAIWISFSAFLTLRGLILSIFWFKIKDDLLREFIDK